MKDKTFPLFFNYFTHHICQIKIFSLTFFSYFKKFNPSPILNKYTFALQTMIFQANQLATIFFESHILCLGNFPKC